MVRRWAERGRVDRCRNAPPQLVQPRSVRSREADAAYSPPAAVVLLIPAAITTVIALFKRPADQAPSSADHSSPARLATSTR
jgi:hypothetical protein